ncbi:hypothetical protein EVAR_23126_1 [Eumeta japonica]|uniref:Uncharacterized protein n=1 Tax=Eumeta variegata TaxID=151549 RepID=A0A4C1VC81_EUMVA|nr:hypothetical protein EVAR_23126_1 [Eumeta japonica]
MKQASAVHAAGGWRAAALAPIHTFSRVRDAASGRRGAGGVRREHGYLTTTEISHVPGHGRAAGRAGTCACYEIFVLLTY